MDLYILRHAIAEEHAALSAKADSQRRLTREGIKKMRRGAKGMKAAGMEFDLILSSPFARARETAEIVAGVLGLEDCIKLSSALVPGGNPKELIDELKHKHPKECQVLLVGHEPYLGRLISLLISGDTAVPIDLKKGGLCRLTVRSLQYGRCATLKWLLTTSQTREIR